MKTKLSEAAGVLWQTKANRSAVHLSCAAMPLSRIQKMRPQTADQFRRDGLGLISVDDETKEVRFFIQPLLSEPDPVDYQAGRFRKKLWRYLRDREKQTAEVS